MKRLVLLALAVFAATQADGQGSAAACYLGASFTTCYKPVVHTSMEGPAAASVSGYLSSTDWTTFNGKGAAYTQGNLTEATSSVLTIGSGTNAVFGSGTTIQVTKAATTASGYLSSTDWNTFNNKGSGTVTSVTGTAPVVSSGGTTPAISMHVADASDNGYLSSTDWTTFNSAVAPTRAINTTAPLTGGGNLSADRTFGITQAGSTGNGYLSSTDWNTFNNKGSGTVTSVTGTAPVVSSGGTTPAISMHVADASDNGYLSSTDWTTFNNKLSSVPTATPTVSGTVTSYFSAIQSGVLATASTNATQTTADGYSLYTFSTGSSDRTFTLAAASANTGRTVQVKKTDSGTGVVIVTRAGGDTIDGNTTYTLGTQYSSVILTSDGTNWNVLGSRVGDYIENACSANTNIVTTNTYGDITNATVTLYPGKWMIGYHVVAAISRSSGNAAAYFNMRSGSSTETANTFAFFGWDTSVTVQTETLSVSTVVTVTSNTTYKLSGQTSDGTNNPLNVRCNADTTGTSTTAWGLRIQ